MTAKQPAVLSFEEAQTLALQHGLKRVDSVSGFGTYLKDCWKMRHFALQYAIGRIISVAAKNRLGLLWEFLTPLMTSLMYFVAFGIILGTRKDSPNFLFFLIAGVLTWQLFIQAFNLSSQSLISGKDLASSMRFPRVLIPLSAGIQAWLRTLPPLLLLYTVEADETFRVDQRLRRLHDLGFDASELELVSNGDGTRVTLVARVVDNIRDFTEAIPIFTRFLMFTSGIFYSVSVRFAHAPGVVKHFAENQPVALLLNTTRGLFIHEDMPARSQLIFLVGGTFSLLLVALVIFWRGERPRG